MGDRTGERREPVEQAAGTAAAEPSATAGRRSRTEQRYGAALGPLVQRKRGDAAGAATVDDVATVAVENKGSGRPVDAAVRAPVEAHLGADLSRAQVHEDPLAREASAAMGARAFAHGNDVFLGPGESGSDLGLMAHELTHVVQQQGGAAAPQRQVTVGAASSPAETQADQVSAAVTSGQAAPASLLVDDGPVQAGQMLKATFVTQLHDAVSAAAREELGVLEAALGCPYIDQYFGRYSGQPAATVEKLIRRYAPATRAAPTAAELIPAVVERVREGVRRWRDTGEAPPDIAAADPAAASAASQAATAPSGGESLDSETASRMSAAFGTSFDGVQVHTDAAADALAERHDAAAFTAGQHVFFARGEYQPGQPEGDALLAHELGHTLQQGGGSLDKAMLLRRDAETSSPALEANADQAAEGVMARLYGGVRAGGAAVANLLRSDVSLQRCPKKDKDKDKDKDKKPDPKKGGPEIAMTKEAMGEYEKKGMEQANQGQSLTSGIHYDYNYEALCRREGRMDLWKDDYRLGYANPDYFERKSFMSWKLKKGKSASEGVKAWLKGLTVAECTSTVTVLEADGIRAALGNARFDELFGRTDGKAPEVEQLILGQAGSTDRYLKNVGDKPGDPVGKIGDRPAEVGTLYYFQNHPKYPQKHPGGAWRGENAFYMGKSGGTQMWEGLGARKTEKAMLQEMVDAYDADRDAADQRELDAIKARNGGTLPAEYKAGAYPEKIKTVEKLLAEGGGLKKGGLQVDIDKVKGLVK